MTLIHRNFGIAKDLLDKTDINQKFMLCVTKKWNERFLLEI
ncbi:18826_t:CDS:2 [Entrophospora sp. SA101]|nr:18826_t:CDS:2 [Entrophospora sp. SA101]